MNPVVAMQPFEYVEMVVNPHLWSRLWLNVLCSISGTFSAQFIHHNVATLYAIWEFCWSAGSFYLTDVYASEVSRLGEVYVADPLPIMNLHCKEGRRPAVFLRFRSAW